MKKFLWSLLIIFIVTRAGAQGSGPARLAIVAETPDAATAGDVLNAELSKNSQIQLLERNEIEKVYQEQALSSANRDYLKLGQILGADGLLLIRTIPETNSAPALSFVSATPRRLNFSVQLIAVKPGVLLASEQFFSVEDISQWASGLANHLNPLLPKLTVLVEDAVPISIVNLRSAFQSPETKEVEQQLTTLTIDRLSRERQLFVLERRRMQLLASEKELKGMDDSAFWNGSYLLDGTLDRNGYTAGKISISVRMSPPKGGAPVSIEVTGDRTNLPDVVNQLAIKICESLKLARNAAPWNAADEAQKYFEEAKWALKWELFDEAQAASESAWAMGKRDLECAMVRIDAYARDIPIIDPPNIQQINLKKRITFVSVTNPPDPENADRALHLLQLYREFGQSLPPDEPKFNSASYYLGLDVLEKASGILRQFHFHPEAQELVSEKLMDIRAMARRVADRLAKTPNIRDTYWRRDRGGYDEFKFERDAVSFKPRNLFQCEVRWGCFWQERPEDCIALYRSLMESPLFVRAHEDFWFRDDDAGRLAAWNAEDRARIPKVWQNFVAELNSSTDPFLRMEAKALEFKNTQISRLRAGDDWAKLGLNGEAALKAFESIQSERDQKMNAAWRDLFDFVFSNYDQIVTNREVLLDSGLGLDEQLFQGGMQGSEGSLSDELYKQDIPRLRELGAAYSNRQKEQAEQSRHLVVFENQKKYLASFTPYNSSDFYRLFSDKNYSKSQAAELKPLVEPYCSNMVAQAKNHEEFFAHANATFIKRDLGEKLDHILNPPPASPAPAPAAAPQSPAAVPAKIVEVTNALVVKTFFAFPTNELPATNPTNIVAIAVMSYRMHDDALLLDLDYKDESWLPAAEKGLYDHNIVYREAVAIWRPSGTWEVIPIPHIEGGLLGSIDLLENSLVHIGPRLFIEMFNGAIYISDKDTIRRYDLKQKEWSDLPFPGQSRAQLFTVNGRLYAASAETISEILENGQSTHILASIRRTPPASSLDSRNTLGLPILFAGPGDTLRVALEGEIFAWQDNDWNPVLKINSGPAPFVFRDVAFFRSPFDPSKGTEFWRLEPKESEAVLCWRDEAQASSRPNMMSPFGPARPVETVPDEKAADPLWKGSHSLSLGNQPVVLDGANVYFFINRSGVTNVVGRLVAVENNGRNADLVCLVPNFTEPLIVPIRFNTANGSAPQSGRTGDFSIQAPAWMECSKDYVFVGHSTVRGVWALPKSEIQAEIDRQVRERRAEVHHEVQARQVESENKEKAFLTKFDLNRDGRIEPEEKESALSDAAFLEFKFDEIDTNHNWQLDAVELRYFDANTNGILDAREEAGIHAMQRVLAARILEKFDQNKDGQLDGNEFVTFFGRGPDTMAALHTFQNWHADSEIERIAHFLEIVTEDQVTSRPPSGSHILAPFRSPLSYGHGDPTDTRSLKQKVEWYWRKHNAVS